MNAENPSLSEQANFWDRWNGEWRSGEELEPFAHRQATAAKELAARLGRDLEILEVGCGTGWLSAELVPYGRVTGIDLSPASIERAKARGVEARFVAGDFSALSLGEQFDLVVSADVIAHVADQEDFVDRIAGLVRPGGRFLLMTQNAFVWNRTSRLAPRAPGQIRNWPSLARIRELFGTRFEIEKLTSIVPIGNRGVLRFTGNRFTRRAMHALLGEARWNALLERARLGREYVIVARRTDAAV